tara:strand:+ start:145 stop:603 length:459 start_codon:yes stop_codon:yes gene_type:complete
MPAGCIGVKIEALIESTIFIFFPIKITNKQLFKLIYSIYDKKCYNTIVYNRLIIEKNLNIAKEKKLNAIKSEILEITRFVTSNKKDEDSDFDRGNKIEKDYSDTFTLTDIVNNENKVQSKESLAELKNELNELKSMLTRQEIAIKEILLKIK